MEYKTDFEPIIKKRFNFYDSWLYGAFVILCFIIIMVVGGWIIITLLEWFSGDPLLEVFSNQWKWLKSLRWK